VVFRWRLLGIVVGSFLGERAAGWRFVCEVEAADFQKRDSGPEEHAREEQVQSWASVHGKKDSLGCASVQRVGRFFRASGPTDCAMQWGRRWTHED
jgi:hypothetical protein